MLDPVGINQTHQLPVESCRPSPMNKRRLNQVDVDELAFEEAEQIQAALEINGNDAEALASAAGHTPQWIRRRAAIAGNLTKEWKKVLAITPDSIPSDVDEDEDDLLARNMPALYALSAAHLEMIAVLPEVSQDQLLDRGLRHFDGVPTVAQLRTLIRELERPLKDVLWDLEDSTLTKKAGACTTCPKRKGSQTDLFEDAAVQAEEDTCLDASCYAEKAIAAAKIVYQEERKNPAFKGKVLQLRAHDYGTAFSPAKGGYERHEKCGEKAKGAIRAVVMAGPGVGSALWVKKADGYSGSGGGRQRPLKERREELKQKRTQESAKLLRAHIQGLDAPPGPLAGQNGILGSLVVLFGGDLSWNTDIAKLLAKAPKRPVQVLFDDAWRIIRKEVADRLYNGTPDARLKAMAGLLGLGEAWKEVQAKAKEKHPEPAHWRGADPDKPPPAPSKAKTAKAVAKKKPGRRASAKKRTKKAA